MEPENGSHGSSMAGAVGLSADAAAASSKPEGKGLLARMPPHLADACIAKMCVFNFVPGDVIIEHNTIGTSMYFLDHGSAVAEVDGVVVNSFAAGDFFGEISFVATATSLRGRDPADFKVRRTANVVAREHCRCLELKVQDLFAVFGEDSEGLGALLGMLAECAQSRIAAASDQMGRHTTKRSDALEHVCKAAKTWSVPHARADTHEAAPLSGSAAGPRENLMWTFMRGYVKSKALGLLESMTEKSRMECITSMNKSSFKSGECIIRKGSIGASLFLIESGSAVAVSNGTVIEELPEVSVNAKPYLYPT